MALPACRRDRRNLCELFLLDPIESSWLERRSSSIGTRLEAEQLLDGVKLSQEWERLKRGDASGFGQQILCSQSPFLMTWDELADCPIFLSKIGPKYGDNNDLIALFFCVPRKGDKQVTAIIITCARLELWDCTALLRNAWHRRLSFQYLCVVLFWSSMTHALTRQTRNNATSVRKKRNFDEVYFLVLKSIDINIKNIHSNDL